MALNGKNMLGKRASVYAMLLFSTIFWGISFIFTKELFNTEEHLTVTILITMRLFIATLIMLPSLLLLRKMEKMRKEDVKWFLLLALAEPFMYNLCETSGVRLVSGSLASVIVATIPLFVPFGMWAAYRQPIRLPMLVGVGLSLIGVGLMIWDGGELSGNIKGILFLGAAVVIAVVYTLILVRVVDHYQPATITTYQNLIGLIYYIPLLLLTDASSLPLLSFSFKMIGLLAVLGICCSTLAYVFYNYGVLHLGAARACIFNNAIPVFSLAAAVLLGQEGLSTMKIVGMGVVTAGVVIAQEKPAN